MADDDARLFSTLFAEAFEKCFGRRLGVALTESESKLLSSRILSETGLVIGWKSIKNYSLFIVRGHSKRRENPSLATLDTLARYVAGAPHTDEIQRQKNESHFPYWFAYRERRAGSAGGGTKRRWNRPELWIPAAGAVLAALLLLHPFRAAAPERFVDDFRSLGDDSLAGRGWMVGNKDSAFWAMRGRQPGVLAMYTLRGDNWPDSSESPRIRDLLFREIPADCFSVEVHLIDFFPQRNWQQAGIVLLEDTAFVKKGVRLSLAYNDFAGGFRGRRQILVQAITSLGRGFENPEEVAHKNLFDLQPGDEQLVEENMKHAALRIEKKGATLRFLCSTGPLENSSFKEIAIREFPFQPRYAGIFALKGFVDDSVVAPVYVTLFSLTPDPCGK